jgi:hypothetical protein
MEPSKQVISEIMAGFGRLGGKSRSKAKVEAARKSIEVARRSRWKRAASEQVASDTASEPHEHDCWDELLDEAL